MKQKMNVKSIFYLLNDWVNRFVDRLAGNSSCIEISQDIAERFRKLGLKTRRESFVCRPEGFMGYLIVVFFLYVAGIAFFAYSAYFMSLLCFLLAALSNILEFVLFLPALDFLFPVRRCVNVSAELEPSGPVKRIVYVTAHHDAARELPYLLRTQLLYPVKVLGTEIFTVAGFFLSVFFLIVGTDRSPYYVLLFFIAGVPFLFQKATFVFRRAVPGAGDNLVACAILLELAAYLKQNPPANTRVVFVSFDAEESGLRGSRSFVKRHASEFDDRCCVINIDSIYREKDVHILVSDINGTLKLSETLAREFAYVASSYGFSLDICRMTFGGGGTDAASFARCNVPAVSIIGIENKLFRRNLVYHTRYDLPGSIEPAAVEKVFYSVLAYVSAADKE
ncbi:M28 family peptidase [Spirochaetia bacterium 38H-sp]|uniref:M28 family peptidase n=1 Tax=Rarispira pelagica TaxID=3141764 RepID=A0ABU9UC43_9SPIR